MNNSHLDQADPYHSCTVVNQNTTAHLDFSLGNNHSALAAYPRNCKHSNTHNFPLYTIPLGGMKNLSFGDGSSSKGQ